jgi:hypothetical protein
MYELPPTTMRKLDQLRRPIEYCRTPNTEQVRGESAGHLAILDMSGAGDTGKAADLMHARLGRAKPGRVRAEMFSDGPVDGADKRGGK